MINSVKEYPGLNSVQPISFSNSKKLGSTYYVLQIFNHLNLKMQERPYVAHTQDAENETQRSLVTADFFKRTLQAGVREVKSLYNHNLLKNDDDFIQTTATIIKKIDNINECLFTTDEKIFIKDIEDIIKKCISDKFKELDIRYQLQLIHSNYDIPVEERKTLESCFNKRSVKKFNIECLQFAFYKLRERRVIPLILGDTIDNDPRFKEVLTEIPYSIVNKKLHEWGYFTVQNPQAGDLILYVNDSNQASHYGVLESANMVVSKWGPQPVYSHPIEIEIDNYGTKYILYRKGCGDGLEDRTNILFKELINAQKNFSHPAFYSPLSPLGCLQVLSNTLTTLMNNEEQKAIACPPHGKKYFENLNAYFNTNIQSIKTVNSREESLTLTINRITQAFEHTNAFQ